MYKQCKTEETAKRQQYMIDVLIEMMQNTVFDEISVSSLCRKAGIPRKSFYRYFDSKEDLLHAALDSLQEAYHHYSAPRRPQNASVEEDLTLFYTFWLEHRGFLSAVRYSKMSSLLVASRVRGTFIERKGDRLTACFAITGLYGVLLEWAYEGFRQTPEEMARHTKEMFTRPLCDTLFVPE